MCLCVDDFREQLIEDSVFLRADWRLDTELVDKLILQLNRIYPQILTDKEATKVRSKAKSIKPACWFTLEQNRSKQWQQVENTFPLHLPLSATPFI